MGNGRVGRRSLAPVCVDPRSRPKLINPSDIKGGYFGHGAVGFDRHWILVEIKHREAVVAAEDDSASELVALGMHAQDATDALHPTARTAPKPVDDGEPAPAPIQANSTDPLVIC